MAQRSQCLWWLTGQHLPCSLCINPVIVPAQVLETKLFKIAGWGLGRHFVKCKSKISPRTFFPANDCTHVSFESQEDLKLRSLREPGRSSGWGELEAQGHSEPSVTRHVSKWAPVSMSLQSPQEELESHLKCNFSQDFLTFFFFLKHGMKQAR